jgi:hypothetical protein
MFANTSVTPVKNQVHVPRDVYEGIKFMERTKAIPYSDLRDGKTMIQHAQTFRMTRVAQWVGTHPNEYETGSRNKSFCSAE